MCYYPIGTWVVGVGIRVLNPGGNKPGVGSRTKQPTRVIGGGGSSKRRTSKELRDTSKQLETIDPHIGLAYEAAARKADRGVPQEGEQPTKVSVTPTTEPPKPKLFSTVEAAQGMSYSEPRFVSVSGGKGFRVPAAQQTILSRERPRYEQALDIQEVTPKRRVETEITRTEHSGIAPAIGRESRILKLEERERNLQETKSWIYGKLKVGRGDSN